MRAAVPQVLFHSCLAESYPAVAKALRHVLTFTRLVKCPGGLFASELGEMRSTCVELLPLLQTAASTGERRLKNFHQSPNHHKCLHAADLKEWLGSGGTDECGELMQKLLHTAYREFSSKQPSRNLLEQVSDWIVRYNAVEFGKRFIALCHADLVLASQLGADPVVHYLLEQQLVDLLIEDSASGHLPGSDALCAAVTHHQTACMRMLLAAGVDVNARDTDKQTVLIYAARAGDAPMVSALTQAGALLAPTWRKLNAVQWAMHEGHEIVVQQLLAHAEPSHGLRTSRRAPAPKVDAAENHLMPPPRDRTKRFLDLTQLRPVRGSSTTATANRALANSLPGLAQQLEYSLRVRVHVRGCLWLPIQHRTTRPPEPEPPRPHVRLPCPCLLCPHSDHLRVSGLVQRWQ